MTEFAFQYRRPFLVLLITSYICVLLGNLFTRTPWVDEVLVANPAWNLVTHGSLGTTCIEVTGSKWTNVDRHTYNTFPLGILNLALSYKLIGFNLASTRLPSLFWAAVLLNSVYMFLRALHASRQLAVTSVVLVAIDYNFMVAATFARVDVMCAALGFSALAFFSTMRPRHSSGAVLVSALLAALSLATHPNGVIFLPALLLVEAFVFDSSLSWKTMTLGLIPFALVGSCWLAYLIQDWGGALDQIKANADPGRLTGFLHPLTAIQEEITGRYLTAYGLTLGEHPSGPVRARGLILLVYLISLVAACWLRGIKRQLAIKMALALLLLFSVYFTWFEGTRFTYYMVLVTPFWCILLASLLVYLSSKNLLWLAVTVACLLAVLQVGGVVFRSTQNSYSNTFLPAVNFLKLHASEEQLVYANVDFAFGYGFSRNVKAEITLGYRSKRLPDFIVIDPNARAQLLRWAVAEPAIHDFMLTRIKAYTLVYDFAGYQIYHR